jgi:hypothetical protein
MGGEYMKRRAFYREYYDRTNRVFSDKIIWSKKEDEEAWRKGQIRISKFRRKILIIEQYFILFLCWIPLCFDQTLWKIIPFALLLFLLSSSLADFSIIKIELLYCIYRKNNVYSSVLYDIFLNTQPDFLDELKNMTKKEVKGYIFKKGGKFYGKYFAMCRNKSNKILLTFKRNKVIVKINEKPTVIQNTNLNRPQLLTALSDVINENI